MQNKREYSFEIDFTKGILVVLMIMFHIRYVGIFESYYEVAKTLVYRFHMPGNLVLSGFLVNCNKPGKEFIFSNLRKIVIPYLIFEFLYVTALYLVQKIGFETTNHAGSLNIIRTLKYLFIGPIGPYWYLHTLVLCNFLYFISKCIFKDNCINTIILFSMLLFIFSCFTDLFIGNYIYYIIGVVLKNYNNMYSLAIKKSWFSIIPVMVIACITLPLLDRFSVYGIIITYMMLSFCLVLSGKLKCNKLFAYFGQNSYSFVLFSPLFTVICGGGGGGVFKIF
jgi:fucose 4-O-acetylase-like acetyltransferase